MVSAGVFVPGKRRLTNGMLTDLRAAGVYAGRAASAGKRPRPGFDKFAAETQAIRWATGNAWVKWMGTVDAHTRFLFTGFQQVSARFFITGHGRHDPDAWFLLAKPALDGWAASFGASDRFDVCDVGGRVARVEGESWWPCFGEGEDGEQRTDDGRPGFWMEICLWGAP